MNEKENTYETGLPMKKIFDENGFLQEVISGYECRKEQLHMAEFIYSAMNSAEGGLVEAGTGTGKTLAYLVPAIEYALEKDRKVAITTETKALQKQILDKDLPVVKKIFTEHLGKNFKYSLCLGSSNYPCKKRFELLVRRGEAEKHEISYIDRIAQQFEKGKIFTRFDVTAPASLWSKINREPDGCNSYKCVFASKCAFQKAKKEWAVSDVLVMNHYLFFSNIASGRTYLPRAEIAVFDEAHSVEDIASAQLGFDIDQNDLLHILSLLYRKNRRNNLIRNLSTANEKKSKDLIDKITAESERFFPAMSELLPYSSQTFRTKTPPKKEGEKFHFLVKELVNLFNEAAEDFGSEDLETEFDIARGKLALYAENLGSFVFHTGEDYVYWIEKKGEELIADVHLRGQPVVVSKIMKKEVYPYHESCFFVSATLAAAGNFSYFSRTLGTEDFTSLALASPFDYRAQSVIFIPRNMPEPNNDGFLMEASRTAAGIIEYLEGNCLLLFTSYRMLGEVKNILLDLTDYRLYSQDDYTASEAMNLYLEDHNSVLMGTHSFWQGIDLPGDLLRGIIMMRLPFSVPDSPLVQARTEKIREAGMNPFMTYQVPEAMIKFRQGFGRLIRSRTDRGIVAILDSRTLSKPYGKQFLQSLPETRRAYSLDEMKRVYDGIRG